MDLFDLILRDQPEPAEPILIGWGILDPRRAFANLRRMSALCNPSQFGPLLELLAEAIPRSADPDRALNNLERFAQRAAGPLAPHSLAAERPFLLELFTGMFGFSQFMADFLVRYPHYAAWLGSPGLLDEAASRERIREELRTAVLGVEGFELRQRAAIRWLRGMMVLLGARVMLGRIGETEFMTALSHCAGELIEMAIAEARSELEPRFGTPLEESGDGGVSKRKAAFAVIAMGKLGADELNFSSDIDLQFVYSAEGWTTGRGSAGTSRVVEGRITNHDYFCRMAARITAFLGSSSDEGYLYRVDLRLRPDGEDGPLARSLPSFEAYHEVQARPWERMALIKGRAIAGEPEFCRRFDALAAALVFDRALGLDIVSHIRELKWKIDAEVATGEQAGREIKRGEGGIREIEFYVQALQLIHGSHRPALRKRATLEVVDALADTGIIPADEAAQMKEDYLFLRVVEHRLQMMDLRQTHTLPVETSELRSLARRCGLHPETPAPEDWIARRWSEIRERVHARFVRFFGAVGVEDASASPPDPSRQAARLIMAEAAEKDIIPCLTPFGLESPNVIQTLRRLGGMGRSVYLTEKGREAYGAILPTLIREAAGAARPESALRNLENLAAAFGSYQALYEILGGSPFVLRLLIRAFGAADGFAATLAAHPEYMDYLYDPAWLATPATSIEFARRIGSAMTRLDGESGFDRRDTGKFAGVLARFRRLEHLRVGLGEFAGALGFETAAHALSAVADGSIEAALERARELFESHLQGGITVLAMGKLGTRELNYHSDLDLIFCRADAVEGLPPERWDERATGIAAWAVDALTKPAADGVPFSADTRLRPEGAGAPLAPPLSRYLDYYASRAELWEFQSLMKVRCVAGDTGLGGEFMARCVEVAGRRLRGMDPGNDIIAPIRSMRRRIEESSRAPRWILCDFKKGHGGLMDLEFLAQAHQLMAVRACTHVTEALAWIGLRADQIFERCAAAGRLSESDGTGLARDYRLLRRLESRTRLLFETEKSQIPAEGENFEAVRRAAGDLFDPTLSESEAFRDRLLGILADNRRRFESLMPGV